jgi:hypothetical protein
VCTCEQGQLLRQHRCLPEHQVSREPVVIVSDLPSVSEG